MDKFDFSFSWPDPIIKTDLFIRTLSEECKARRLKALWIDPDNVESAMREIQKGNLKVTLHLDMASETYDAENPFTKLIYRLKDAGTRIVDDPDVVKAAADKSITHHNLVRSKIPVPKTIIIRHWDERRRLTAEEITDIGFPFVIKPALGFGQKGVKIIQNKKSLSEIFEARKYDPGDNYLVQEFVDTLQIEGKPAWFRVYHLFGEIIPCWWNPTTHEFHQVTLKEMGELKLIGLARIASEIGRITRVDWFSCEIAISAATKKMLVIDYMNDQCAIYPKSEHLDGVPDELIVHMAKRLVEKAWRYTRGEFTLDHRAIWFPKIQVKDESA